MLKTAMLELPAVPALDQPVTIRVGTSRCRDRARQELRLALCHVLGAWTGTSPEAIQLCEAAHGPEWRGDIGGHALGISFSYADDQGWMGLVRGGAIGLDAMRVTDFDDMELVAREYLGGAIWQSIVRSDDRARAFATAWTGLEASLKCIGQPLSPWPANRRHPGLAAVRTRHHFDGDTVVAVATRGNCLASVHRHRRRGPLMPP